MVVDPDAFLPSFLALLNLAGLSALTGLIRRNWFGILATGMILVGMTVGRNPWYIAFGFVLASGLLLILRRVGLLALAAFIMVEWIDRPPLIFSRVLRGPRDDQAHPSTRIADLGILGVPADSNPGKRFSGRVRMATPQGVLSRFKSENEKLQ